MGASRSLPVALVLLLPSLVAAADGGVGDLRPGWQSVELFDDASEAELYLPDSGWQGAPGVVFLHGMGSRPKPYQVTLAGGAEASGAVVVAPQSSSDGGWGFAGDSQIVSASVELLLEIGVDPARISIAGHSAGGAYAYVQAYLGEPRFAAVFALSAPFQPVPVLARGDYVPPIRLYYGTADPNYRTALPRLEEQWGDLGVPWEIDVHEGYGHNSWPPKVMEEGVAFLVSHRRAGGSDGPSAGCSQDDEVLCLFDGRFEVTASWSDYLGRSGVGRVVTRSERAGLLWFFAPDNWELLVKVLDGCEVNDAYWVYAAATTDVAFELRVTDRYAQRTAVYRNPLGRASPAIVDPSALSTCP